MEVDLTGPQDGYSSKLQIQLERKEDQKARGLASPDLGDTLAMTFSVKVATRQKPAMKNFGLLVSRGRPAVDAAIDCSNARANARKRHSKKRNQFFTASLRLSILPEESAA